MHINADILYDLFVLLITSNSKNNKSIANELIERDSENTALALAGYLLSSVITILTNPNHIHAEWLVENMVERLRQITLEHASVSEQFELFASKGG